MAFQVSAEQLKQERLRAEAGIQCPECYGVRISPRKIRFDPSPNGFQCEECGCQWGARR